MIRSTGMRRLGYVTCAVEMRKAYKILVVLCHFKRPCAGPGCKWEISIIMDRRQTGCEVTEWFDLAQDKYQWRTLWTRKQEALWWDFMFWPRRIWRWLSAGMLRVDIGQRREAYRLHRYGRPDDGGSELLWNVCQYLADYTAQHSRIQASLNCLVWPGGKL
jgi:hypothetical protein